MDCEKCGRIHSWYAEKCPRCGHDNPHYCPPGKFYIGQRIMMRFAGGSEVPGTVYDNDREQFGTYSVYLDPEIPYDGGRSTYHQNYSSWHGHLRPLNDGSPIPEKVQLSVNFYRKRHGITNDPCLGGQSKLTGMEPMIGGRQQ